MLFRGSFEHTIDLKGRTSVPVRFREVLAANYGDKLIATAWFEPNLQIWPLKSWEAFEERLSRRNPQEPGVKQIYRVCVSTATDVEIDKLGRILVPSTLRTRAALEKDVVWVGLAKNMELWSKAGWDTAQSEALSKAHSADVERVLAEISG
jgi:MraZ protein